MTLQQYCWESRSQFQVIVQMKCLASTCTSFTERHFLKRGTVGLQLALQFSRVKVSFTDWYATEFCLKQVRVRPG